MRSGKSVQFLLFILSRNSHTLSTTHQTNNEGKFQRLKCRILHKIKKNLLEGDRFFASKKGKKKHSSKYFFLTWLQSSINPWQSCSKYWPNIRAGNFILFEICKNKKIIKFINKIFNHKRLSFQPWKPIGLKVFFLTIYKYFSNIILLKNFIFLLFKKFMTVWVY